MKTRGKLGTTSTARTWRQLLDDVRDRYVAARHRQRQSSRWHLDLLIDPRLLPLPPDDIPGGARALSGWLAANGIAHAIHAPVDDARYGKGCPPAHRLIFHHQP